MQESIRKNLLNLCKYLETKLFKEKFPIFYKNEENKALLRKILLGDKMPINLKTVGKDGQSEEPEEALLKDLQLIYQRNIVYVQVETLKELFPSYFCDSDQIGVKKALLLDETYEVPSLEDFHPDSVDYKVVSEVLKMREKNRVKFDKLKNPPSPESSKKADPKIEKKRKSFFKRFLQKKA